MNHYHSGQKFKQCYSVREVGKLPPSQSTDFLFSNNNKGLESYG